MNMVETALLVPGTIRSRLWQKNHIPRLIFLKGFFIGISLQDEIQGLTP